MADLKAIIYARYSSSSQREESIEGQVKECTTFAERHGYSIIGTYADRAISGTTDNRPQFQQMIKDSKRKLFDTENAIMSETYDGSTCGCDGNSFIDRIIGREFFRPLGACLLPATGCKPVA